MDAACHSPSQPNHSVSFQTEKLPEFGTACSISTTIASQS
jgi:hypothetical protein